MLHLQVKHAAMDGGLNCLAMQTMGDRIKLLRESKNWTQGELAGRLTARGAKVTISAISQWERGETKDIKLRLFLALVAELGTTHEYLVHGPVEPGGRDTAGKFRRLRAPGSGGKP